MDNNKVVYLHKDSDGVVRYVGSGTNHRANTTQAKSGRGKPYEYFVETNGKLRVEIVASDLDKNEAEDLERQLYDVHRSTILNCNRPTSVKPMTKEMFEEYVYYDETSPSCLRWKVGGRKIKVDLEAGGLNGMTGYYSVMINGKRYRSHRIIALLHNLNIKNKVVDHIDRDRSNNKISNLRVVSQQENCNNSSLSSNNTSGVQGVHFEEKLSRWVTTWYENKKQKVKRFPVSKYESSEVAFQAAVIYRQQMISSYHSTTNK